MIKPLNEQVVVVTGASSGIGRETAIQFGRQGASVVLAARNEEGLKTAAREVEQAGGQALIVPTDVADWEQVQHLAQATVNHFGRIDTWVNNAAVSAYATAWEMTVEEIHRILHVNLFGQIHGAKAALEFMRVQGSGTIIFVASALAKRSVPLQSAYCSSKHGVKGFAEALRMELEHENMPINVTLIMPSSINTPLFRHARSKMGVKPMPIPPIYEPGVVADAILFAAENESRDIVAGGAGKAMIMLERLNPRLADWYMQQSGMFQSQKTEQPDNNRDNLFAPIIEPGSVRGEWTEQSKPVSLYTKYIEYYPARQRALFGAVMGALFALFTGLGRATE